MLRLTCTIIFSVDLAHYGVSRAKDWVSVDCGTMARVSKHFSYGCFDRQQETSCFVLQNISLFLYLSPTKAKPKNLNNCRA